MIEVLKKEAEANNLTNFVKNLITDSPGENIARACQSIYPLNNVVVRKVKMLKKPKMDATKLNELFKEGKEFDEPSKTNKTDDKVDEEEESKNLLKK